MRWAAVAILALFATCGSVAPSGAAPASMFISSKACPAYQSIKKRTNPGNIRTEPGTAYKFVAETLADASRAGLTKIGFVSIEETK